MTDDETFTAICADFPFDRAQLEVLRDRLQALRSKAKPAPAHVLFKGTADGTIDPVAWSRLNVLTIVLGDMCAAIKCIEEDGDPDEFIPF